MVDDKKIFPLYKHCIGAVKPSFAAIGLPFLKLTMQIVDLQIRFALEFWTGRKEFPSKAERLREVTEDMTKRLEGQASNHQAHRFDLNQRYQYCQELADTAEIKALKPVIYRLDKHFTANFYKKHTVFRTFEYKVLDDDDFECKMYNDIQKTSFICYDSKKALKEEENSQVN